jgi:lysosomal acid lipase/cholesteryl ester hydrolase
MPRVPLIGRLSLREYIVLFLGFTFIAFESILRLVVLCLPKPIILWFYERSRSLFHRGGKPRSKTKSPEKKAADRILNARDFMDLCCIYGYIPEEHVVLTKDGYLLGLHRLSTRIGENKTSPGTSTGKPVVYLHHGLLMNSEVWICLTDAERALPFVLVEQGFDVWLGNNRSAPLFNQASFIEAQNFTEATSTQKSRFITVRIHLNSGTSGLWISIHALRSPLNVVVSSIDDFAWHDIPDSIHYILEITKSPKLSYVGFSQGTAQAFAALSIHPQLNEKINVFIALAPALSPAGLAAPIVDGLMKAS